MKLSNAPRGARQSVLVYGPPKSGKTQLVSQLSKTHNLIWFDLENGHATLFKLPPEQQERIELINLMDTRSFPIAIETCLKVIKGGPLKICEGHGKVDCAICKKANQTFVSVHLNELGPDSIVVFDSLTQLTNSAIAHITKAKPEDYKLEYDDWGNLGKLMDIFLSHVQQAKFTVVCLSHETEVEMEDGKLKLVPTSGTRNFSRNTAKYFGHVCYANMSVGKHVFKSTTTAANNVVMGSRTDVALEKMDVPTLESIFAGQSGTVSNSRDSRDASVQSNGTGVREVVAERTEPTGTGGNSTEIKQDQVTGAETNGQIAAGSLKALLAARAAQGKS